MKKYFFLSALLLLLSLAPAAAAQTTTLTVDVPAPDYELVIPAEVTVDYKAESCSLAVPAIRGGDGREDLGLQVTIVSSGVFACPETATTIPFTLTLAGAEAWRPGDSLYFSRIETGAVGVTADGSQPTAMVLSFQAGDWEAALPGTYTATITYTASFTQPNG